MRRRPIAAAFWPRSKARTLSFRLYGPFEVASVLTLAERHQRITRTGIVAFMDTLRRLPIQVEHREALWLWQAVIPLAREHRLSAYDAAYLELARRDGMHLATLDHDLEKAGRTIGVPIFEVT